jgi:hypothetical protein
MKEGNYPFNFFGLHEERVLVPQELLSALAGSATNLSPYGRQDQPVEGELQMKYFCGKNLKQ